MGEKGSNNYYTFHPIINPCQNQKWIPREKLLAVERALPLGKRVPSSLSAP